MRDDFHFELLSHYVAVLKLLGEGFSEHEIRRGRHGPFSKKGH
jgi:hypothetical protein